MQLCYATLAQGNSNVERKHSGKMHSTNEDLELEKKNRILNANMLIKIDLWLENLITEPGVCLHCACVAKLDL